jgi:hypothetical protein
MWVRFTQQFEWKELIDLYNLTNPHILNLRLNWNVAPTQNVGVIVPRKTAGFTRPCDGTWSRCGRRTSSGRRELRRLQEQMKRA